MIALAPLATFIVFVLISTVSGTTLDTSAAFTGLSLISLLAWPMNAMIRTIPMLNAANACFVRIQSFLISDARQDHRLPLNPTSSLIEGRKLAEGTQGIELKETTSKISELSPNTVLLDMQNVSFAWYVNFPRSSGRAEV
jgi:ATP-binding cassette, subfamily C (CFTR/MRP), member 1